MKNLSLIEFRSEDKQTPFAPTWDYKIAEGEIDDVDFDYIAKYLTEKKEEILKIKPSKGDGYTGLGGDSVTARHADFNIFNFGNSKHFQKVHWDEFVQGLFDTEIDNFVIHCMLNRSKKFKAMYSHWIEKGKMVIHEYNFEKQYELMKNCDIVFLPIVCNSMLNLADIRSKSPNRIMDAIYSGKPVITNEGIDSWLSFKQYANFIGFARAFDYGSNVQAFRALINTPKEEVNEKIRQGQKYIDENHTPEIIGKQWIDLENKVGKVGF